VNSQGAPYSFVTVWRAQAPIGIVFDALFDADAYPRWWKAVLSVNEVLPGGEDGIGRITELVWKAPLGYRLRFTLQLDTVDKPTRFGGPARGELEGTGYWTLREVDGITRVQNDWNVRTNRSWMNLLAPIARPAFASSHYAVMREGATGLAALLGVPVEEGEAAAVRERR
jgi:uncharacterized protein YndB with AHSA1/START domain